MFGTRSIKQTMIATSAVFYVAVFVGQPSQANSGNLVPQLSHSEIFSPARQVTRTTKQLLPNIFASAQGRSLSDFDIDTYINRSVTGADRRLAHKLMAMMPANLRGDFVYLGRTHLVSNNPAMLRYVTVRRESPTFRRPKLTRQNVSIFAPRTRIQTADYSSQCSPPGSHTGPYARNVSVCGFTTGWGFVNVPCGTSQFAPGDAGYLYFELQGSGQNTTYGKSLVEGGLQYNSGSSVLPYVNVYDAGPNGFRTMQNNAARFACDQNLAIMHGATTDGINGASNYTYTMVGQVPSNLDPSTNWVSYGIFSLQNPAWLFNPAPGDIVGVGTDAAGILTPCTSCSISQVTSIAQNQLPPGSGYQVDGSQFGINSYGNQIHWMQVAFGEWQSNCTPGTTLCTFEFPSDVTLYTGGTQTYPDSSVAETFPNPLGWGAYETYDGIDLAGGGVPAAWRKAAGAFREPPPPLPCSADAQGNCAILQSRTRNGICDTGMTNIKGMPIFRTSYTNRYSIYRNGRPVHYLETATATQQVPSDAPCTVTTSWYPGEPRVQYNDASLP